MDRQKNYYTGKPRNECVRTTRILLVRILSDASVEKRDSQSNVRFISFSTDLALNSADINWTQICLHTEKRIARILFKSI